MTAIGSELWALAAMLTMADCPIREDYVRAVRYSFSRQVQRLRI
jgi:hypothetical protein